MANHSTIFIAASTNRFSYAADISNSRLIAFGSSKLIALWDTADTKDRGVYETVSGHDGIVTAVRFVDENLLVSADDQGSIHCWRRSASKWDLVASMKAHERSISSLCVLDDCLVTGASESLVKIWRITREADSVILQNVQSLSLKGKYPLCLALTKLPWSNNALILATGATDQKVHVWVRSGQEFVASTALSGHEDWVRSLAFRPPGQPGDPLVLASGSQDSTIRLWNVEPVEKVESELPHAEVTNQQLSNEVLDALEASMNDETDTEGGKQISLKQHIISVKSDSSGMQQFTITFDALLVGHEAGVTSLVWRPNLGSTSSVPSLLSTSTDSSVAIWSPSSVGDGSLQKANSIWINRVRFGDIGGQRLGGFTGGLWGNGGYEALAWGWNGGWRRWRCSESTADTGLEQWTEIGAVTGHFGPVKDIDWSPNGEYLISVGSDQTTRVYASTLGLEGSLDASPWHEIGRPQVHGYDLVSVRFMSSWDFVSIADEKVARVFEAPRGFAKLAKALNLTDAEEKPETRPVAASVPPLGLSNKAVTEVTTKATQSGWEESLRRPFEGELAAMTLWPETEKIFGHGYELISLAVSHSRRFVATACKATSPEHAVVRVYRTDTWQLFGSPLQGHTLTITRITFSPDDRWILSVSRDRTWRIYEVNEEAFKPIAADKTHARIIWNCAWTHESDLFATASRDKTIRLWEPPTEGTKPMPICTLKFPEAATSVAFRPMDNIGRRLLAVGLETGGIYIFTSDKSSPAEWKLILIIECHVDHVHQLTWRTINGHTSQLASCSEDGTVRLHSVQAS